MNKIAVKEAHEAFDQAIKTNPDISEAWNNKGLALGKLGKYNEALEAFDRAIKISPDNLSALRSRDELKKKLHDRVKDIRGKRKK